MKNAAMPIASAATPPMAMPTGESQSHAAIVKPSVRSVFLLGALRRMSVISDPLDQEARQRFGGLRLAALRGAADAVMESSLRTR